MNVRTTLDGRVTMDPAAFARFCETSSSAWCADGPSSGPGHIAVDGNRHRISLTAEWLMMRDRQLLPDLHKAAQAGRVDGVFMSACVDGDTNLEAVVFRNSETWAGSTGCINNPVDIGPYTLRRVERVGRFGGPFEIFQRVEGSDTKHRVVRYAPVDHCFCEGVAKDGQPICRNDGKRYEDDGVPVVDISTFMPPSASGQLEQALIAAAGAVNAEGLVSIGRLAWHANGPGQHNMFRRWLETFKEATGERYVTWLPDLFDNTARVHGWVAGLLNFRPICANTGGTQRGACPAFLISDTATSGTHRVPAHVDNVSLADAAKLAEDGADPAEAVALFAAITDPDRT